MLLFNILFGFNLITNFNYYDGFKNPSYTINDVLVFNLSESTFCQTESDYVSFSGKGDRYNLILLGFDYNNNLIYQDILSVNGLKKVPCMVQTLFEVPFLIPPFRLIQNLSPSSI